MWVEKFSNSYAKSAQLNASGIKIYKQVGTNIVKGATQVNGHSLKLHFWIFKRSQVKHTNLHCNKCF